MPLPKNEIDNTNSIVTENDQDNSFEKFLEINDEDFDKSNSNINTGDLEDKIIEKIK
jgi:hypothetical protein